MSLTLRRAFATDARHDTYMPTSSVPESAGKATDETGLLEVLRLLIQTRKASTTSDLLKYAAQYGAPEAEERLRVLEAENVPVDLAFDAISVQLRLIAHKRNSALLAECRGHKVGMILPIPPDLVKLFVPLAEVNFLVPEEAALHGPMHDFAANATAFPVRFENQSLHFLRLCPTRARAF
ncbi:MAG: hypothetical protein DLM52_04525, partial [Chthoniobacterales bacterium]